MKINNLFRVALVKIERPQSCGLNFNKKYKRLF